MGSRLDEGVCAGCGDPLVVEMIDNIPLCSVCRDKIRHHFKKMKERKRTGVKKEAPLPHIVLNLNSARMKG